MKGETVVKGTAMKVAKKPAAADGQLDTPKQNVQQLRAQWREELDFNKAKGYKWTPSFARWLKRGGKTLTQ